MRVYGRSDEQEVTKEAEKVFGVHQFVTVTAPNCP